MVSLRVEGLCVRLGEFDLRDITLAIAASEYFCILGPTGAGKSVLIECIAGLQRPDRGRVFLGDADITDVPPERRGVGYVPQDYALFPNMTVRQNIAFGLRVRRTPPEVIAKRVASLVELFHIEHLLERQPLHLSGGEKQRVALSRALAVEPKVLLLDEPLAAVDEQTRDRLCAELHDIQRATGVTVIHISHNFDETLAVADRIGIMHAGQMVQVGTPDEIFSAPQSRFVAEFTRAENVIPLAAPPQPVAGARLRLSLSTQDSLLAAVPARGASGWSHAIVRPEAFRLYPQADGPAETPDGALTATVTRITERGHLLHFQTQTDSGLTLTALKLRSEARAAGLKVGDRVCLLVSPDDVHLL